MLIKKNDIGAEIISILTKGMYLDPKDALREYIQNGIDADAKDISVKIRQDIAVVQDNGFGMDKATMRKSVRIGISDKNPKLKVGFMGIGIYSSFHLCDQLHIYSKTKDEKPNKMVFDFLKMRNQLEKQRELRLSDDLKKDDIIALQDLMEDNIEIYELNKTDFPKVGTRIEMINLEPTFFKTISQFSEISTYLEQVIPLPFNPDFKYGKEISHFITQTCEDKKINHSFINLKLQINNEIKTLYRPYTDELFDNSNAVEPEFITIGTQSEFFGIAWGCLNSSKNSIKSNSLRGFILKKNGFSIGTRNDMLPYFGRQIYFNRYVGEFIVLNQKLLPNASRSEFEYSPLRITFQNRLKEVAEKFNRKANDFQETLKAIEETNKAIMFLNQNKLEYEFFSENIDKLFNILWESKQYAKSLSARKKRFEGDDVNKYLEVIGQLELFSKEISALIELKKTKKKGSRRTEKEIALEVEKIPELIQNEPKEDYNSIVDICNSIGLELNKELKLFFDIIDENFIRFYSSDDEDYKNNLRKLKNNFEEQIEE